MGYLTHLGIFLIFLVFLKVVFFTANPIQKRAAKVLHHVQKGMWSLRGYVPIGRSSRSTADIVKKQPADSNSYYQSWHSQDADDIDGVTVACDSDDSLIMKTDSEEEEHGIDCGDPIHSEDSDEYGYEEYADMSAAILPSCGQQALCKDANPNNLVLAEILL